MLTKTFFNHINNKQIEESPIKRENCPFCGNRWIRRSDESPVICPDCKRKFYPQDQLIDRHQK